MKTPVPVAVLGATGYAGEGTVKILLGHPHAEIVHVGSDRLPGTPLSEVVPELAGACDLTLAPDDPETIAASGAQVIFLCKKSPEVTTVVPSLLAKGMRLIDIGAEFRLRSIDDYRTWHHAEHACPEVLADAVYGLSEWAPEAIAAARVVGNPGCYATAVLLPLLPLLRGGALDLSQDICAIGYSGVSGAGKKFVEANNNLFYAMSGNLHSYRAHNHQHRGEINQECSHAAGAGVNVRFIPHLAPLVRGIHVTITATPLPGWTIADMQKLWQDTYARSPFVRPRETCRAVEVGTVAGSNCCDMAMEADGDRLIITAALDNLVKGASGQAVQNFNIMCGFAQETGLLHRCI
ncbi:MAG: N-acetyl-gamma-glutamyl-phosphate reductase [Planctomycetota bacterium]|nr:MAG: N-acetyl-gamma-glutamyl-phosphate reductase [Planctomycetota bacterium]